MKVGDFVVRRCLGNDMSYGIILEVHARSRWAGADPEPYRITVLQSDGKVLGWYIRHAEVICD